MIAASLRVKLEETAAMYATSDEERNGDEDDDGVSD